MRLKSEILPIYRSSWNLWELSKYILKRVLPLELQKLIVRKQENEEESETGCIQRSQSGHWACYCPLQGRRSTGLSVPLGTHGKSELGWVFQLSPPPGSPPIILMPQHRYPGAIRQTAPLAGSGAAQAPPPRVFSLFPTSTIPFLILQKPPPTPPRGAGALGFVATPVSSSLDILT